MLGIHDRGDPNLERRLAGFELASAYGSSGSGCDN